jgi:hypothetical protein
MATVAAIVNSVRVTVRATPQPAHRVQLATRLAFAAALSEAAPLAVEGFVEAGLVDSAAEAVVDFTAAEAVVGMAAVATAANEIEYPKRQAADAVEWAHRPSRRRLRPARRPFRRTATNWRTENR